MMRMPRSRACRRTSAHCSKKSHCSNATSRTSRPSSRRARSSASASRFTSARSQELQAAPPFARFRAMNRAKSSSQAAFSLREGLEGLAARRARLLLEGGEGLREERPLELDHGTEVHLALREAGPLRQVGGGQQALLAQAVEADEQRVAREGREALVGRVAVAGGAERQHLPEALAGLRQEVEEGGRLGPELADAVAPGQRRGVEQDAGGSLAQRLLDLDEDGLVDQGALLALHLDVDRQAGGRAVGRAGCSSPSGAR